MKNAKKMIVAAGFVSLLFASLLPQANGQVVIRGEGLVLFESIDRGVQLSQDSALNFGTIARFSGSGSSLSLTCSSADGDDSTPTAGVLVLTGETPFSCAQFTVKGLSAPSSSFKIKVWVSRILESRIDTNDDTLTPSLFVYGPNNRAGQPLDQHWNIREDIQFDTNRFWRFQIIPNRGGIADPPNGVGGRLLR